MDSTGFHLILGNIFLLLVCNFLQQTYSLEAIQVATLPNPSGIMTSYYDGSSDTILLFGGQTEQYTPNYDILSFSITNHTVQKVGQIPEIPSGLEKIPVFPSSNGSHLFYLVTKSQEDSTVVFKFDPVDGSSVQVGEIPIGIVHCGFADASNGAFYAIGEEKKSFETKNVFFKLDLESETIQSEILGIPEIQFYLATSTTLGNTAYVFGNAATDTTIYSDYYLINLETLEISGHEGKAPIFAAVPSMAPTKRGDGEIIIIGGYSDAPKDGLIRMKVTNQTLDYLPVENFPKTPGADYLYSPSAVYVEKLNRVYFFGGLEFLTMTIKWYDSIWYVDLKTLLP